MHKENKIMQIKIFSIPILDNGQLESELNKFLRTHSIVEMENKLVQNNNSTYWTFCIKYIENDYSSNDRNLKQSSKKIDYKTILDEKAFKIFSRLREIRKIIASEDGVPAYTVFTDEELSNIAKLETISKSTLLTIKGVGDKKIEKFAGRIINGLNE